MRKSAFLATLAFVATIPLNSALSLGSIGSANRYVGFVAAGAWIILLISTGRFRHPSPFHLAVFALFFWALLSLVVWSEARRDVFALPMLVAMVALLWDQCKTRLDVEAALQAYVVGAFLANLSLLYNFRFGASIVFQKNGVLGASRGVADRFAAAGTGPNALGVMAAAAIAIAAYLLVSGSLSSKWLRWLNIVSIPIGIVSVALTGSRTATVSLAIALLYIVSLTRKVRTSARVLLVASLVIGVFAIQELVPDLTLTRILGTVDSAIEGDLSYRDEVWAEGWDAFLENPLVGVGAYAFNLNTPSGKSPHSIPVEITVELGTVGLVLFGTAMAFAIGAALALRKQGQGIWLALLLVCLPGVLTLSWSYEKITWLVLSLVVAAFAAEPFTAGDRHTPLATATQQTALREPVYVRPTRARWDR